MNNYIFIVIVLGMLSACATTSHHYRRSYSNEVMYKREVKFFDAY